MGIADRTGQTRGQCEARRGAGPTPKCDRAWRVGRRGAFVAASSPVRRHVGRVHASSGGWSATTARARRTVTQEALVRLAGAAGVPIRKPSPPGCTVAVNTALRNCVRPQPAEGRQRKTTRHTTAESDSAGRNRAEMAGASRGDMKPRARRCGTDDGEGETRGDSVELGMAVCSSKVTNCMRARIARNRWRDMT